MKDLVIYAKTIDAKAKEQIYLLLDQKPFENCKVRIMPDVHAGVGCVIGFTADLGDKVIPNIVGVDIGCGMLTVELSTMDIDFAKLDKVIRERVPAGRCVHDELPKKRVPDLTRLHCFEQLKETDWLERSIGTLGGGNHFIEIDVDEEGYKYLIIHTGSRNLGKQVAEIYQQKAIKHCHSKKAEAAALIAEYKRLGKEKEISSALEEMKTSHTVPRDLCYLEGQEREEYFHDMKLCQEFAEENRMAIADAIIYGMGWTYEVRGYFHTVHNYIGGDNIVRKGAISAGDGEVLLIPINMRDGCIIGRGLGNEEWNYSAPHGAGRLMSRSQAKTSIALDDYALSMDGIYTTSVSSSTLDEAPQAYKPMDEIMELIADTVKIEKIIRPVYNFKAGD